MTYQAGGQNVMRDYNFMSYQQLQKPNIQDSIVKKYNSTLVGMTDLIGAKAAVDQLEYSWFELNRTMPKVKATTAGAGAGAEATFVVHADSKIAFGSYSPYDSGVAATTKGMPVRLYDVIQIKPASGTASAGSYINCLVTTVTSNTGFKAYPLNSALSVPAIASADEIIIIGNLHGEGTGFQKGLQTTTTKITENLARVKHKYNVTNTEKMTAKWATLPNGDKKFFLEGDKEAYYQMLNLVDSTLLIGEAVSNTALSELFVDGTNETDAPIYGTNGLTTQILAGGNILNYSSATGITLADLYDYNEVIAKEDADYENTLHLGISLDQQFDRELGDRVSNGAYMFGANKSIDLGFNKVTIGSFTYGKRCLEAFNNPQIFAADGYGYPYEGFMLPTGKTKVSKGAEEGLTVPTFRKRYLANNNESREMVVKYYDGLTSSETGVDKSEVRYLAEVGYQVQRRSATGYMKRA